MAYSTISLGGDLRQCWRTPKAVFDRLHAAFHFTVDACANADNFLLPHYWTRCQEKDWTGETVFCNPPFKMMKEVLPLARKAKGALVFCPAISLTSVYLGNNAPDAIIVPSYRIKFDPPNETMAHCYNPVGTILLLYGQCAENTARLDLGRSFGIYRREK